MKTVCQDKKCVGCGSCNNICPVDAIEIIDTNMYYNAVIDENKCINCNACRNICQINQGVELQQPQKWYQGWTNDYDRKIAASGGAVISIASGFIELGGVVCTCKYYKGHFIFDFANKKEELVNYVGSKYVKSEMLDTHNNLLEIIKNGIKVLFIGLPCQVASVKKYIPYKYHNNLYTIDLICHGTPSKKMLELYLEELGYDIDELEDIRFRNNNKFNLFVKKQNKSQYEAILYNGERDRYSVAFLNSLFYTDNCYECKFAQIKRVSDITVGDSWGTTLNNVEKNKGISLLLCQTTKGETLLENSDLKLQAVDLEKAIDSNHQLSHPSNICSGRVKFFTLLNKGIGFSKAVNKALPIPCLKQKIKKIIKSFEKKL